MTEIRKKLKDADRIPVPDLWPDILTREPQRQPPESSGRRVAALAAALAVVGLATVVLVRAFQPTKSAPPIGPASPNPSTGTVSSSPTPPKANGVIAFIRVDRTTVREGEVPRANLYTVNSNGSGLNEIGEAASASVPGWSPDGTRIAFVAPGGGSPGIFISGADGSHLTRVTSCDAGAECSGEGSPAWSPDGMKLAFWSDRGGQEGLWMVGVDGHGLALLTARLSFGVAAWSPDGSQIAVSGNLAGESERRGIFLISARTGEVLGSIYPEGLDPGFGVGWSPDGDWLSFDALKRGGSLRAGGIYLVHPNGDGLRLLTSESCPATACRPLAPAWSPDGRQIVYTAADGEWDPSGLSGDLLLIDVETVQVTQLTKGPFPDCCPAWQPTLAP